MRKIIFAVFLFAAAASCSSNKTENKTSGGQDSQDTTHVAAAVYQCPMDCENGKTYDKPGQCPVCGMDLEPKS